VSRVTRSSHSGDGNCGFGGGHEFRSRSGGSDDDRASSDCGKGSASFEAHSGGTELQWGKENLLACYTP